MVSQTKIRTFALAGLLALTFALSAKAARAADGDGVELKGPINAESAASVVSQPPAVVPQKETAGMGGLAPGEDGTMTQDMILVTPDNPHQQVGKPLSELIGSGLKLHIDRSDIIFDKLRGIMITVTNETNRPIVVDGDLAKATVGGKSYTAVPVSAIQLAITPHRTISKDFEDVLTVIVPAAVTVGASPTVRDFRLSRKPILERYGPDELRRKVEYSRFGRRILWTQQKMQGILYFQTTDPLAGAQLQIPAGTMFDSKDAAILTAAP